MSATNENSKEKAEGSAATEKAATDANKEEEKADLVSQWVKIFPKNYTRERWNFKKKK